MGQKIILCVDGEEGRTHSGILYGVSRIIEMKLITNDKGSNEVAKEEYDTN